MFLLLLSTAVNLTSEHITIQGFGSAFFADPYPGKNLHADPDPDPGGIRGVKGKNDFFLFFFTFQMILNNGCLKSEQKK